MRNSNGDKLYWCDGWLSPPPEGDKHVDLDDWADSAEEAPSRDDQLLFDADNYTAEQIRERFKRGNRKPADPFVTNYYNMDEHDVNGK